MKKTSQDINITNSVESTLVKNLPNGRPFAKVDLAVLDDTEIKPNEKIVFAALCALVNTFTRTGIIPIKTIAAWTGYTARTVWTLLHNLAKYGVIHIERKYRDTPDRKKMQLPSRYTIVGHNAERYQQKGQKPSTTTDSEMESPQDSKATSDFWFTMIDNPVLLSPSLSNTEKLVYMRLCRLVDLKTHSGNFSVAKIANGVPYAKNTVRESLHVLEKCGLIEVKKITELTVNNKERYFASKYTIIGGVSETQVSQDNNVGENISCPYPSTDHALESTCPAVDHTSPSDDFMPPLREISDHIENHSIENHTRETYAFGGASATFFQKGVNATLDTGTPALISTTNINNTSSVNSSTDDSSLNTKLIAPLVATIIAQVKAVATPANTQVITQLAQIFAQAVAIILAQNKTITPTTQDESVTETMTQSTVTAQGQQQPQKKSWYERLSPKAKEVADHLLMKTGRPKLTDKEVVDLNELVKKQLPARINREIDDRIEMFIKNSWEIKDLHVEYFTKIFEKQKPYVPFHREDKDPERTRKDMEQREREYEARKTSETQTDEADKAEPHQNRTYSQTQRQAQAGETVADTQPPAKAKLPHRSMNHLFRIIDAGKFKTMDDIPEEDRKAFEEYEARGWKW